MHIGTFTESGTWADASRHLRDLARLGVSLIELLPVAAFPGRFGWGYDGVCLFAPTPHYGDPHAFRAFVDEAHALGLGVILDVVYNHLGPDGAVLQQSSPHYASQTITEWGAGFNFDGEHAGPVREFVLSNVAYWMNDFIWTGFGWTRCRRCTIGPRPPSSRTSRARCGRTRMAGACGSWASTNRRTPTCSATVANSTHCGTTISITPRWSC